MTASGQPMKLSSLFMRTVETDVVVIGGGVAGLWTLAQLRKAGYEALLLENNRLGGGQTLCSQGIIHGGMKYALGGLLSAETESIANMPETWLQCLKGQGEVDLRGVRMLSEHHYMWSERSLASRFTTFFGSKMLRGRIEAIQGDERPELLRDPSFKGNVYRLNDIVLDTYSLIETLAHAHKSRIYKVTPQNCHLEVDDRHHTKAIFITAAGTEPIRIHPRTVIFTAGRGNQELLNDTGLKTPQMQLRPLHMVMMQHADLPDLYAHCIGTSAKPRVTITTHPGHDGQKIWYIGGELAERGVERDDRLQIEEAMQEIQALFPWKSFTGARWKTLRVDRAEPAQENFLKPDNAFAQMHGNNIIGWPTKLALAPNLGQQILDLLKADQIHPSAPVLQEPLPLLFPEFGRSISDIMAGVN